MFKPPPPRIKQRDLPIPEQAPKLSRSVSYEGGVSAMPKAVKLKGGTIDEKRHKDALAQLGCMVCRRLFPLLDPGPVELHHLRADGWGKGDYRTLMPLCAEHHRGDTGIHGLGTRGFPKHYGFDQQDLLNDALALLGH